MTMAGKPALADIAEKSVYIVFRTEAEARQLVSFLGGLGCTAGWPSGSVGAEHYQSFLREGMYLSKGRFWMPGMAKGNETPVFAEDFMASLDPSLYLTPGEKVLAERFNALCGKVDRLTLLVEKLCAEILPKDNLDKPRLK